MKSTNARHGWPLLSLLALATAAFVGPVTHAANWVGPPPFPPTQVPALPRLNSWFSPGGVWQGIQTGGTTPAFGDTAVFDPNNLATDLGMPQTIAFGGFTRQFIVGPAPFPVPGGDAQVDLVAVRGGPWTFLYEPVSAGDPNGSNGSLQVASTVLLNDAELTLRGDGSLAAAGQNDISLLVGADLLLNSSTMDIDAAKIVFQPTNPVFGWARIGDGGSGGGVMVRNGGQMLGLRQLDVSSGGGSVGFLNIDGPESKVDAGLVTAGFGDQAVGVVTIDEAAELTADFLVMGGAGFANVLVRGSTSSAANSNMRVAQSIEVRSGNFHVEGRAHAEAARLVIDGEGTVTVGGDFPSHFGGSTRVDVFEIGFGENQQGSAIIQNGGEVEAGSVLLGFAAGANGTLAVRGTSSQLSSFTTFNIGNLGDGIVTVRDGGEITVGTDLVVGSPFATTGNGELVIDGPSSHVVAGGNLRIGAVGSGRVELLNGGSIQAGTELQLEGNGVLLGHGLVVADFENRGTVIPGSTTSPLQVEGSYVQHSGGTLEINIQGSAESGRIEILGGAQLDGELVVAADASYTPSIGDAFEVVVASMPIQGSFSAESYPTLPSNWTWETDYFGNSVTVRIRSSSLCDIDGDSLCSVADADALVAAIVAGDNYFLFDMNGDRSVDFADLVVWLTEAGNLNQAAPYLAADINLDGVVDGADFLVWNSNKFATSGTWSQADLNADGVTDGQDFLIWNSNKFLSSLSTITVPEPMFTLVWALAALPLGRRRDTHSE